MLKVPQLNNIHPTDSKYSNQQYSILAQFSHNPLLWGKYYFPHHFRQKSPPFHLQIIRECISSRLLAVAAPRGSSKSTLLSFLIPLHRLCFREVRFIVIVSNTYKKACGALENMKQELKDNKLLVGDFPITIRKDSEGDSIFTHVNGHEIRVLCKGNEQIGSVRGEKFGAYRPDLIIIDDVEDDEMVRNPERRKDLQDLFDEALIPAGDVEKLHVIAIGTILHDDSLMAKLVSPNFYKDYTKLFYQARETDSNGNKVSLWNDKWTLDDLAKLERDKPDVFAKEMQNDPVSGSMQIFHKEDFRYWRIENGYYLLFDEQQNIVSKGLLTNCRGAISCDLAWEEGKSSDYSVALSGLLTPQSDILLDSYICKKGMRPDEYEDIIYSMRDRIHGLTGGYVPVGFEKAKLEKVAKWFLGKVGRKRNDPLSFKDLQWDGDKITRIEIKLQPRYSQHMIYHKTGMGELEYQLTRFPSGSHDDLPDAEQGLVQLLQFPKSARKEEASDNEFMWWRQQAIDYKNRNKKDYNYVFGNKRVHSTRIPATMSYR